MTISYTCEDQLESTRKDGKSKSGSMRRCKHPSDRNGESDDGVKRFHGDGLVVRMHSNHRVLEITGDGCRIVLSKNSGSVHVVGDGCRLRVNHNEGNIEYTGDGGRVLLGSDSVKGNVKFVGDGGKVMILDSGPETKSKIERKDSGKSKERLNMEASYLEGNACSCKKVINKTLRREKRDADDRTLNQEELDNVANDIKEKSQGKYGKCNEEVRKSGSTQHQTVTKIITKIQTDGQYVRKFFGNSSFIVNSRNNDDLVMKSVSGRNIEIK